MGYCPKCRRRFREPEDEQGDHGCPSCEPRSPFPACYPEPDPEEEGCPECGAESEDGELCGECLAEQAKDAEADAADAKRKYERDNR